MEQDVIQIEEPVDAEDQAAIDEPAEGSQTHDVDGQGHARETIPPPNLGDEGAPDMTPASFLATYGESLEEFIKRLLSPDKLTDLFDHSFCSSNDSAP